MNKTAKEIAQHRLEREATHQQAIAADLASAERDAPIRERFHAYLVKHEGFALQTTPAPGRYYPGAHAQMLWECWLAATLAERERNKEVLWQAQVDASGESA